MNTAIKLIIGLGNPGPEYDRTRHNAGADFVMELAHQLNANFTVEKKFFGLTAKIQIAGQAIHLLIPATYMNRSGQSVSAIANFYKIKPEEILVAHDELDLAPGVAKLKQGGGHGGHNGLRDIISALGNTTAFTRLRLGIGHPGNAKLVADYVLKKASPDDQQLIDEAISASTKIVADLTQGQWNQAMKTLHSSK